MLEFRFACFLRMYRTNIYLCAVLYGAVVADDAVAVA
jgi:hypothetical protein